MTEQQKDFVHMYLKHRDKIIAHNIVYGNNPNYDSVESSANRLLRIPEIAETIRSIQDTIRHEVEEEIKAQYREELLTIYDKRRILKKIATGEMYIEQKYKGKNCTQCSQYISPTYHMMMQALKEDSKLAGHYPFKQNGKWIIPALQNEQKEEEIISTLEIPEQKTTIETTPLLFLGGDIGASASGGDKRQSGWLTPDGHPAQDENQPENDNKGQQLEEKTIDNTSPLPCPQLVGGGAGGEQLPQDIPENDNKRQQSASSPWGRSGGASLSVSHTDTQHIVKELHK